MTKRTRKPPIKPELRREWLRRNEDNGESPPQIATKDTFDVRTVRKQIDLAKQEREAREARSVVLRDALQGHYEDLRKFAERLNSRISGSSGVQTLPDDDLIEAALRQHLPRSPMWGYLAKQEGLKQRFDEAQQRLNEAIEEMVKNDRTITTLTKTGLDGVIPGVTAVLVFEAKQWLNGNTRHSLKESLLLEPAGEGLVNPRFGFSPMGIMNKRLAKVHMPTVHDVLGELESRIKNSESYTDIEKYTEEIGRFNLKLREELAIIRLRRIVPGHCKYCPL